MRYLVVVAMAVVAMGCNTAPINGAEPVQGFELDRYLGTWYEIARLDHPFERGLSNVTAEYARETETTVSVVNRGFKTGSGEWDRIQGTARFRGDPGTGSLEVSFFGPFYAGYHIVALDAEAPDYGYALVVSSSPRFMWILARGPELDEAVYARLVAQARGLGIDTDGLIRVEHDLGE